MENNNLLELIRGAQRGKKRPVEAYMKEREQYIDVLFGSFAFKGSIKQLKPVLQTIQKELLPFLIEGAKQAEEFNLHLEVQQEGLEAEEEFLEGYE